VLKEENQIEGLAEQAGSVDVVGHIR